MKVFAAILILTFCFGSAFAHSCATFYNLDDKAHSEKLQKVAKIFYGEIISITETADFGNYSVKFKVIRAWKGIESNEITVKFSNPCGTILAVGEKKMIYGYISDSENLINVNCCNLGLFDDEKMKREYGEGKIIEQPQPIETNEDFWSRLWRKIVSVFG